MPYMLIIASLNYVIPTITLHQDMIEKYLASNNWCGVGPFFVWRFLSFLGFFVFGGPLLLEFVKNGPSNFFCETGLSR